MYCFNCGRIIREGSKFCEGCGQKITNTENQPNNNSNSGDSKRSNSWIGIMSCSIGTILLYIRSAIKSKLYIKSVNTGWAGKYEEPLSAQLLIVFGTALVFCGLIWFGTGIIKKGKSIVFTSISMIILGIILIIIKASIHSAKYNASVRSGWIGIYNEPAIIPICNIWGWSLMVSGILLIILSAIFKEKR